MDKFRNKYRISSTRLQHWDYGNNAAYFITICTLNREHYFGEIAKGEMYLNGLGKIVESEWLRTLELRPDMNLELGAFVVMPNHFHGIVIIGENEYNANRINRRDATHGVSATIGQSNNQFGPQSKNLASIIRGFKSSVTTHARKTQIDFGWQARFHDHIIRNAQSFENIQNYIMNNPMNWDRDTFFRRC